jgi:glycosyltransferase involved in cell wall biosynthesis
VNVDERCTARSDATAAPAEPRTLRAVTAAVVCDAVYPWHKGGKEVRYHELLPRLAGHGVDPTMHTMNWWGDCDHPSDVPHVAISPLMTMYTANRRSMFQSIMFALACLRLIGTRADVIEADHMPGLQMFTLRLVASVRRKPLVATWNEVWGRQYWKEYLGPVRGTVAAAIEWFSTRMPHHIMAISADTAQRLCDIGVPADRITVIPNGIADVTIGGTAPADDGSTFVFAGRLIDHKRADVAIATLAELHRRGHHDLTLTVIGSGPAHETLRAHADQLGVGGHVRFLAAADDQTVMWAQLKAARILLAPSEREGLGMVVAEALSAGVPALVSDADSNASRLLVDDGFTGSIVASGDVAGFADAAERWLACDIDRQSVAATFWVRHPELTWETAAHNYAACLRALARKDEL